VTGDVHPRTHRLLGSLVLAACLAPTAEAQQFGKNKVRYQDFDFKVLETPHFDIYYYPVEQDAARQAGVLAERWYAEISRRLGHELSRRQPLVLYATSTDFAQTNVVSGRLSEGTGGVTEGRRNRIALPFGLGLAETNHVIGHELVHAFQYDLARRGHSAVVMMPLWVIEGMAEYLTLGPEDPQTHMWMRDAARQDKLPSLKDLSNAKYFPYRYGHGVWSFLVRRYGEDVLPRMLKAKPSGLEATFKQVTGRTLEELTAEWHEALRAEFGAPPGRRAEGDRVLLGRRRTGARIHTGPSLSPDGKSVIFVSEKDQFSIDIFLADARSGVIRSKLLNRATDPHYDSIQFLDTSAGWDPNSRRIAFSASRRGLAVVTILDARSGRVEHELQLEEPGTIGTPSWSPDGKQLAFAGQTGGWTDLYTYDLQSRALRRRTNDAYGDLQPTWSRDGRSLAFVTDRFSTCLDRLLPGTYRLALFDLETGNIRELPGTAGGRNFNPQFGETDDELYFVGDPDGRPSVYHLALSSRTVCRLTPADVPVAGITALSPAISYAPKTKMLAYSVFKSGGYEILTTTAERAAETAAEAVTAAPPAPPVRMPEEAAESATGDSPVAAMAFSAGDAGQTRDFSADFGVRVYRPRLSLESIGQPYLSAGGGSFGSFFRAGMGFSLGDMLGDQQLSIALQVGRHRQDFAGRVMFLNRWARWTWGMAAEYLPLMFGRTEGRHAAADQALERLVEYRRQDHVGLTGITSYAFNSSHRLEFTAGGRQVSFARNLTRSTIAVPSGREIAANREEVPYDDPIRLAEASAALVYDSAIFGAASPVLGRRYRFEVAPATGSLTYTTLIGDFRQYLMPVRPFTLALRARAIGRVGADAGDPRVVPLVLSLRDQVRGYDLNGLSASSCSAPGSQCSLVDLLSGRRLVATNVEVRFPIPGLFSGTFDYGPIPLEGFLFVDAATVSTREGSMWEGWNQHLMRAAGTGTRLNAAGLIFELAGARTFDGAGRGWKFAFNLKPGF
jgi:hypothetical protein